MSLSVSILGRPSPFYLSLLGLKELKEELEFLFSLSGPPGITLPFPRIYYTSICTDVFSSRLDFWIKSFKTLYEEANLLKKQELLSFVKEKSEGWVKLLNVTIASDQKKICNLLKMAFELETDHLEKKIPLLLQESREVASQDNFLFLAAYLFLFLDEHNTVMPLIAAISDSLLKDWLLYTLIEKIEAIERPSTKDHLHQWRYIQKLNSFFLKSLLEIQFKAALIGFDKILEVAWLDKQKTLDWVRFSSSITSNQWNLTKDLRKIDRLRYAHLPQQKDLEFAQKFHAYQLHHKSQASTFSKSSWRRYEKFVLKERNSIKL